VTHEAPRNPVLYQELRRLADALMAGERDGHTLQPTALAHEVWLRLRASRNAGQLEHGAFIGLAAQAMRRILTEHARRRGAAKRGGAARRTTLAGKDLDALDARDNGAPAAAPADFALDLDAALGALERLDPELVRLVELRFYAGASLDEIAAALGSSPRTVKRRWRFARAWLRRRMQEDGA
jgi:RNA polymerase sigma factor (TIGR02999 family)